MINDRQVAQLRKLLAHGESLSRAAWKTGMDEKSARKYRSGSFPSEQQRPHDWRTRDDPFDEVWDEVFEQLEAEPKLQAKTLFAELQRKYPGRFQDGQLRTFQRGVKRWRVTSGPPKEVYFSQMHEPGRLGESDFTHVSELNITIQGQRFDHLLYHFVLTYSNWEWASICHSESFESLSEGLQEALWQLGAVPSRHRSDRLSAAVNNLSNRREFTARYQGLASHYDMAIEKTNPNSGHENGDVESLHRHFKTAIDQALMLRGSRDFPSVEQYEMFLRELLDAKNAGRTDRLQEERHRMKPLPSRRLESFKRVQATVNTGSLIRVQQNVYSVHSRLIGERVDVRIHANHLEVWHAQRLVERLPRLRGASQHHVNYRHVIDTLVRKPGAFEHYQYREDLFPTSHFRMAYDQLRERHAPGVASREYLAILSLAAKENEGSVTDVLRYLLNESIPLTSQEVIHRVMKGSPVQPPTEVEVDEPDLNDFDSLLNNKEILDDIQGCEDDPEWTLEGASSADVP